MANRTYGNDSVGNGLWGLLSNWNSKILIIISIMIEIIKMTLIIIITKIIIIDRNDGNNDYQWKRQFEFSWTQ